VDALQGARPSLPHRHGLAEGDRIPATLVLAGLVGVRRHTGVWGVAAAWDDGDRPDPSATIRR
jgi:hypothetical protein